MDKIEMYKQKRRRFQENIKILVKYNFFRVNFFNKYSSDLIIGFCREYYFYQF